MTNPHPTNLDHRIRTQAFAWLSEQVNVHGDVLSRELLQQGFEFEGRRIPLVSPQGIFKPKILDYPLSITTAPKGPYEDFYQPDQYLLYKYRGTDPNHRDNVGLRKAMELGLPLAYFYGITPGKYLALWPVYVIGDDPANLTFKIMVDDLAAVSYETAGTAAQSVGESAEARRAYITVAARRRLHQRSFREKVIRAYREQCALCRLRHSELLDAAHILPDSDPKSTPHIDNGISLCKLHHAAFDAFIIGISADYTVEVRKDILDEKDGPMLIHGLQGLHQAKILLPRQANQRPNREYLEIRFEKFRKSA